MPEKYHIPIEITPPRFEPIGKYATVEFREDCAGSCRECVKKKCVYGIFKDNYFHISSMKEPEYLYECQSCFRCVQECTRGIFSRVINPEYRILGDDYWRADIIYVNWYQAHTGKIPVSGAGYRGPFVAAGFESMWTDMSEIVRPTRDGIHGREYISTCVELSRRVTPLRFNQDMTLDSDVPEILELPVPLLFRLPEDLVKNERVIISAAKAAKALKTMMFIMPQDYAADLAPYSENLIPCLSKDNFNEYHDLVNNSRAVELTYESGIEKVFDGLRAIKPDLIIIVKIPLDGLAASRALELAETGVDTLYFYANQNGYELDAENPRFLKDMIREVHLKLVEHSVRQKINLIFSGGIAMAEYVAKAIICGTDAVVVDYSLLLALECRLCGRCKQGLSCPVKLDEDFDDNWGSRRIVNLIGAWHAQLIELMGAMGIREVRRLRGEIGRSMWFEDLEEKSFGPVFGE
ncbi:MAG: glutamate synthase-related protein, partial [Thermodesulfobacteriota bacterium]|nr:glutamate synthase-related protein [Thermodesulfobacteriota bacterium]